MKLDILNTYDHGGDKERVTLVAREDTNLNNYFIIGATQSTNGNKSSFQRRVFFFPSLKVRANEWVRLFSGQGEYFESKELRGNNMKVIHNFFWNLDHTILNKVGDEIRLMCLSDGVKRAVPE